METVPIANTKNVNVFIAPVVVAASAPAPRWATISASARLTTLWHEREMMMGQASDKRRPYVACGAAAMSGGGTFIGVRRVDRAGRVLLGSRRGGAGARGASCPPRASRSA